MITRAQLLIEFNQRVWKIDDHWIWQGYKMPNGYGILKVREHPNENRYLAHRLSLYLFKGLDLYSPSLALHKCDRKDCVNPDHLYIGTQFDNMRDYFRGRKEAAADKESIAKNQTPKQ